MIVGVNRIKKVNVNTENTENNSLPIEEKKSSDGGKSNNQKHINISQKLQVISESLEIQIFKVLIANDEPL